MQSRWFDFGGNTIVRADKYACAPSPERVVGDRWADVKGIGTYD